MPAPVATKFESEGVDNGFPFCPDKVDVSVYDYWTTLSGVNKDSPTTSDTLIADSLRAAMSLFWNYNGCSGLNEGIYPTSAPFSFSPIIDMDNGDYDSVSFRKIAGGFDSANKTPLERVCYASFSAISVNEDLFTGIYIIRMYNGITTEENNFVGYGVGDRAIQALGFDSEFYLAGWADGDEISEDDALEYVTIDGFHYIAWAVVFAPLVSPIVITSDESSATASFDFVGVEEGDITIRNLTFYTYPT